jgi:hypothetical protein
MIFLVCFALAMKEPQPVNQEELSDEIALAQQRSVWIACLMVSSAVVERERNEIIKISQNFGHPYNLLVAKIAAETLEACLENIDFESAEIGLKDEEIFLLREVKKFKVSADQFQNKTLELTKKQALIVQKIKSEINRVDDGFDQQPPVVTEVLKIRNREYLQVVAGIGIAVCCIWVIWKMFAIAELDDEKDRKRVKVD